MRPYRVLFIDDDLEFLSAIRNGTSPAIEVTNASSANAALKITREYPEWDAIVIDIQLPDMSGLELYQHLSHLARRTVLVFLTYLQDDNVFDRSMELEPDDFIMKPITVERLEKLIVNRIRKKSASLSNQHQVGSLTITLENGSLILADSSVELTKKEWVILSKVLESPAHQMPKEELLKELSLDGEFSAQSLDTHMYNLRKKLVVFGLRICTNEERKIVLEQQ